MNLKKILLVNLGKFLAVYYISEFIINTINELTLVYSTYLITIFLAMQALHRKKFI